MTRSEPLERLRKTPVRLSELLERLPEVSVKLPRPLERLSETPMWLPAELGRVQVQQVQVLYLYLNKMYSYLYLYFLASIYPCTCTCTWVRKKYFVLVLKYEKNTLYLYLKCKEYIGQYYRILSFPATAHHLIRGINVLWSSSPRRSTSIKLILNFAGFHEAWLKISRPENPNLSTVFNKTWPKDNQG
jgi:hypothetical protein